MSAKVRNLRASLFPVYFVFFLDNFGFSLVFTIFGPLLLDPNYGLLSSAVTDSGRNLLIGLLFAIYPAAQLLGAPFIGDLADHFGRKKAFYITLIGTVIGYLLSAIGILVHSYVLLLIGRLINGFVAGNLAICLASIADLCPTEYQRGRHYGFIAMTAGLSWIVAMVVGGYLSDHALYHYFNPALPFLLSALLAMLALWAMASLFTETRPIMQKQLKVDFWRGFRNIGTAFKIRDVRFLYFVYLLWVIGWGLTIQWFSPFSIERFGVSQIEISWVLVAFGFSWSFGGSLFNWILLKRLTSSTVAKLGVGITLVFIAAASISFHYNLFGWLYALSAMFAGIGMSNILNLISLSAPLNMQGKVMGLSQSTMAAGWIIGPILGGLFADYINIDWIYYVAAAILAVCLIMLFYDQAVRRPRKRRSHSPYAE